MAGRGGYHAPVHPLIALLIVKRVQPTLTAIWTRGAWAAERRFTLQTESSCLRPGGQQPGVNPVTIKVSPMVNVPGLKTTPFTIFLLCSVLAPCSL